MIEDKLNELCENYWKLQTGNYDIENNYPELLDFSFFDPNVIDNIDRTIERCREILEQDSPRPEPHVEDVFERGLAPVPNNSVMSAVMRAVLCGGSDFATKTNGWKQRNGEWVLEQNWENAGKIEVSLPEVQNQEQFIKELSLFTLDVLVVLAAHISDEWTRNRAENPLFLTAMVTANKLLKYKQVKTKSVRKWNLRESIASEIEKLSYFRVKVKDSHVRQEVISFSGTLFGLKTVKRDFNPHTNFYTPTAWEVEPGQWSSYLMSSEYNRFIGKIDQKIVSFDHRIQRSTENFAKKVMYTLFVLSGGTYYIYNGVKKSLKDLLEFIGEHRQDRNLDHRTTTRNLKRLGRALDYLAQKELIQITNLEGSVLRFIESQLGPWSVRKVLQQRIEFKKR